MIIQRSHPNVKRTVRFLTFAILIICVNWYFPINIVLRKVKKIEDDNFRLGGDKKIIQKKAMFLWGTLVRGAYFSPIQVCTVSLFLMPLETEREKKLFDKHRLTGSTFEGAKPGFRI